MAGSVRLDIVAQAQDKATATMKKVSSGLNQVGKDARKLSGAQKKGAAATETQQKSFLGMSSTLGKATAAMAAFGLAMQGLRAVSSILKGAASVVTEMVDAADNMAKIAPGIGLTAEEFQRLDFALKISGSSMEGGAKAMKKFSRAVKDAQDGSVEAVETIKELGLETRNSSGSTKGFKELLDETADAFAGMDDGIRKTALAQELFGKSGADMLNFLNLGSEGIARLGDEAEALGGVMSNDMAASAEEATDAMLRFDTALLGLKLNLAPVVENLAILADLASDVGKVMQFTTLEGQALANSLVKGLRDQSKAASESITEMTARLALASTGMAKTAGLAKTLGDAERRASAIIAEGNEKAARSFRDAEEFALRWNTTVGLAGLVAEKAAAGVEALADANRRANDAIDAGINLANLSQASYSEEVAGLVSMVQWHDGLTVAQQDATAARKAWTAALKDGNMTMFTTLERLAKMVIATDKIAKAEKKPSKSGGGGGRGIRTRALRAELEKLDITEKGYLRTREASDDRARATIALETSLAKIQASRSHNQMTLRDSTLAIAKAQLAYRQALASAGDEEAKLATGRSLAVVEATRAQRVHVIELELLDMEAMAVGNLTSVEQAALDVARERLEVQRQQIMAMEDSAEQAMAMEKANARVAISERELGQAIKEADLTAHAQAFGEANAVMGNTSSLMSGLNAEAGAMATGIGDVGSAIGTWGESTESQVAAVDGGIAAGQKLTGALVKDQKMQALILGAMEVARGVALSFTNPIAAGAHFASAALFAAVAGGVMGGKKGGGGRASSRAGGGAGFTPTGGDGAGGGTQQVIVTFGDGVILGSPGQVGKAVAQATGALSGTGMQAAGAF